MSQPAYLDLTEKSDSDSCEIICSDDDAPVLKKQKFAEYTPLEQPRDDQVQACTLAEKEKVDDTHTHEYSPIAVDHNVIKHIEHLEKNWEFVHPASSSGLIVGLEEDEFLCKTCKKHFSRKDDLCRHIFDRQQPNLYLRPYFACSKCETKTEFLEDMKEHFATFHTNWQKRTCDICICTFESNQLLVFHMVSSYFLRYKCVICGVKNLQPCDAYSHIMSHIYRKKVSMSNNCDFMSTNQEVINKHSIGHFGRFHCHKCMIQFKTLDDLKTHLDKLEHRDCSYVYNCGFCKLKTLDSNVFIEHLDRENTVKELSFKCFQCCWRFKNESELVTHKEVCTKPTQPIDQDEILPSGREMIVVDEHKSQCTPSANQLKRVYTKLLKMRRWDVKMALIYDFKEENCKICKIPVSGSRDVQTHFNLHFTPCCVDCRMLDNRVLTMACPTHKEPLFRHRENYFQQFSLHNFDCDGKLIDQRRCYTCKKEINANVKLLVQDYLHFCPSCPCSFGCKEELTVHMVDHIAFKLCKICRRQFPKYNLVFAHMEMDHKKSEQYVCVGCNKGFGNENLLIQHLRICDENIAERMSKAVMKSNVAADVLDEMFVKGEKCHLCDKEFLNVESLRKHKSQHPLLQCPLCCAITDSLMWHCMKAHPAIFQLNKKWIYLNRSAKDAINCLDEHFRLKMLTISTLSKLAYKTTLINQGYTCRICFMAFGKHGDIDSHFRIHCTPCCTSCDLANKKYCEVHKKPFVLHPDNYFVNMSCHKLIRSPDGNSFRCKNCSVIFDSSNEIYIIKKYFKKYFQCDECSDDRLEKEDLTFHILGHMVQKRCTSCEFSTNSDAEANRHASLAHRGLMNCSQCSKQWPNELEYDLHLQNCKQGFHKYLVSTASNDVNVKESFNYCATCEMLFESATLKEEHESFHLQKGCPFCHQLPADMRLHIFNRHFEEWDFKAEKPNPIISTLKNRITAIKEHSADCLEVGVSVKKADTVDKGYKIREYELSVSIPKKELATDML